MILFKVDFQSRALINRALITELDNLKSEVLNAFRSLEARYADKQPPGGVFCLKPVTRHKDHWNVDCYGDGNIANSVHDKNYINRMKTRRWNRPMPFPASLDQLERVLKTPKNRVVLGVKSDSFMWMELKYRVTEYFLTQLVEKKYQGEVVIYTRSDLVAHENYLPLLRALNTTVHVYIPEHRDANLARLEEPGAPSIARRLMAIEKLRACGVRVWTNETRAIPGQDLNYLRAGIIS